MADHIVREGGIPILGWAGPGGEEITDDAFGVMHEAGFTVSMSAPGADMTSVRRALDMAADVGIRVLLVHPSYHVDDGFELTPDRRESISEVVTSVAEHPGLYGYYLRDEPEYDLLPALGEVSALIRSLDDYHLVYINHHQPFQGHGAQTVEVFWREYIRLCRPALLTYDHYPVEIGSREQIADGVDRAHVFPRVGLVVKPNFFEGLDFVRGLARHGGLPFWQFTNAVRHGAYPTPEEGHIRFQLFHSLAYGASGLQYFPYPDPRGRDGMFAHPDGSARSTWEIAKRVNADIHGLAPVLSRLESVGVFHHGPIWHGTRPLPPSNEPLTMAVSGDPVTVGQFRDPDRAERYAFVVNTSPCDWAKVTLGLEADDEVRLLEIDPRDGRPREIWPANTRAQLLALAPGEGRLLQIAGPTPGPMGSGSAAGR